MNLFEQVIKEFTDNGWIIELSKDHTAKVPKIYEGKLYGFEDIVRKYQVVSNRDYTTWFVVGHHLISDDMVALKYRILGGSADDMGTGLTAKEILGSLEDLPYLWDTFKNMSIGASENQGENETKWWDRHFPFIMSTKNGYDEFYVINVDNGSIEHGEEPLYEEVESVAESLDDFWKKVIKHQIIL